MQRCEDSDSSRSVPSLLRLIKQPLQNYDTTESKLRREFEQYGPVVKVCVQPFLPGPRPARFLCASASICMQIPVEEFPILELLFLANRS